MKKKIKKKSKPTKMFTKLKNKAYVDTYGSSKQAVIDIAWSLKDVGFGHLVLSYDREAGDFRTDTENMSAKLIEKILILAAPKLAKELIEMDNSRNK